MRLRHRTVVAGLVVAVAVAACGEDKTPVATDAGEGALTAEQAVAAAKTYTDAMYSGTYQLPEATARPIAPDVRIAIVSSGQANPSTNVPVTAAVEACEVAGWTCDVFDGASNPATYQTLVNQAVAADYDGIILQAIDCPLVSASLDQAREAGVKIVAAYSFDCDDPKFAGEAKFDAQIGLEEDAPPLPDYVRELGFSQGQALLARNGAGQKVIGLSAPEFRLLDYTWEGFERALTTDPTSEVVEMVEFKAADLGPTLQQRVAEALLKHPDATAVRAPFTASLLLGVAGAVQQSGRAGDITVIGSEGYAPELDFMRQGLVSFSSVIAGEW
nr:substrate-binding domain-containing protein [Micromonospora sp. DSM 115978]